MFVHLSKSTFKQQLGCRFDIWIATLHFFYFDICSCICLITSKIDPTLKIPNRLSSYLAGILRLCQYMYSIMKCKDIWLQTWDIAKIKKCGIGPFCPDPGAKRHIMCHFAPNGMFHCFNVVQAVLWLIRLTNMRLAHIIAPVKNIDSP